MLLTPWNEKLLWSHVLATLQAEICSFSPTPKMRKRFMFFKSSGVARLGHTGAHALATRGRAPPVQVCNQIISADGIVIDRKTSTTLTVYTSLPYVTYTAPWYSLRTDCKISNFFWESTPSPTCIVCPCCALPSMLSWLRHCSKGMLNHPPRHLL